LTSDCEIAIVNLIEQYECLLNKDRASVLSTKVLDLMPTSAHLIRIPSLLIAALESVNSPILSFAAVVTYRIALL
jgi:hypothetical protein